MSKPSKQCIFCNKTAGSKEHIWPTWMHELLPPQEAKHRRRAVSYNPFDGHSELGRGETPGALTSIRVRAVCSDCNNGWMNRLEAQARPFLTAIVTAQPIALDWPQMHIVAKWLAMKTIVIEHAPPFRPVTPIAYRFTFRERQEIPHYFRIYLANHTAERTIGMLREVHSLSFNPKGPTPALGGVSHNVQTIVMVLGPVFAMIHAARLDNFEIEQFIPFPELYGSSRIFPPDEYELVWPREPSFAAPDVLNAANSLTTFVNRNIVVWPKK